MEKHVSIIQHPNKPIQVTIWRGDVYRDYYLTESSAARLTMFMWNNSIKLSPHLGHVINFWFDYPERD